MGLNTREYFRLLEESKFKEALELRASATPEYIYKFVSLTENDKLNSAKLASLKDKTIWFAPPSEQNDPFEFRGMFLDKQRLLEAGYPQSLIDGMQTMMDSGFILASFTEHMEDNLPMWANYANDHHGYCIKFKVLDKSRVLSVLYEPKRIPLAVIAAQYFSSFQQLYHREGSKEELTEAKKNLNFAAMILKENYFIKHDSWKAEKEYRIVCTPDSAASPKGENKKSKEVGLEVTAVYTGIKCEHCEEIAAICSDISIPCYSCQLSDTDFSVFTEV